MSAQNHVEIAKAVWPYAKVEINIFHNQCYVIQVSRERDMTPWFDLLETDRTGEPTQQAKASALDVLCSDNLSNSFYTIDTPIEQTSGKWMVELRFFAGKTTAHYGDTPPAAIYKAACEVLELEVSDD